MKEFTQEELEYLSKSIKTYKELGIEFNLPPENIRYVYKKYNIKKLTNIKSINDITENQIQYLKDNIEKYSCTHFIKEFNTLCLAFNSFILVTFPRISSNV